MKKTLMAALLFAATFQASKAEDPARGTTTNSCLSAASNIYQTKNLLCNGDFAQKGFNTGVPMYWIADSPEEQAKLVEQADERAQVNGTFELKEQTGISQGVEIAPEAALEYVFAFKAAADTNAAKLKMSVIYCSEILTRWGGQGIHDSLLSQTEVKPGNDFQEYKFQVKLKPEYTSGYLEVNFKATGNEPVKLREVSLQPVRPETKPGAKDIQLTINGKTCLLNGLAVSPQHSFYELMAAKYLQKYLYVSFGRWVDIYTGDKSGFADKKGLIFFGNDFVPSFDGAQLTAGGYALVPGEDCVYVAGKDDGAVQGAFALLASMGLEFYTPHDFTPASKNILTFSDKPIVANPDFGIRMWSAWGAPLGLSCPQLRFNPRCIGFWSFTDHELSILVDPFIYFKDHPEYYPLRKDGKRDWIKDTTASANLLIQRHGMNLCISNPDVQKIAADSVVRMFEIMPEVKIFPIIHGDRATLKEETWCGCEKCKEFGANDTDRFFRFVNIIAKRVKKKCPDKLIAACIYGETRKLPVNVAFESNVYLEYTVSHEWRTKEHFLSAMNMPGLKEFSLWNEKYPRQLEAVLYFPPWSVDGNVYDAVDRIRFFAAFGSPYLYIFGPDEVSLLYYITGKLAWRTSANIEPLVDKFMKGYYGDGAGFMRQYFDLCEETKRIFCMRNATWRVNLSENDEFVEKGLDCLNQAVKLTSRENAKNDILFKKVMLLNNYFIASRSSAMRGAQLKRFAANFGEYLRLAEKLEFSVGIYQSGMTMRDMIKNAASVDIGNSRPWYKSPVARKLMDDPTSIIKPDSKSYEKTAEGLAFRLESFAGGENLSNMSAASMSPKAAASSNICAFAKVLRLPGSMKSNIKNIFDLDRLPEKDVILELEGLDNDKDVKASFKVEINGQKIFDGENKFTKTDWSAVRITVPAAFLKKGENTLEIINTTASNPSELFNEAVNGAVQDHTWGWLVISKAKLILPTK